MICKLLAHTKESHFQKTKSVCLSVRYAPFEMKSNIGEIERKPISQAILVESEEKERERERERDNLKRESGVSVTKLTMVACTVGFDVHFVLCESELLFEFVIAIVLGNLGNSEGFVGAERHRLKSLLISIESHDYRESSLLTLWRCSLKTKKQVWIIVCVCVHTGQPILHRKDHSVRGGVLSF